MTEPSLPGYIQALLNPSVYPHAASHVDLIQTHISYVLLAGQYVYKFKKEVDFGFLDFSTLKKRRLYCEKELYLNRRLCPNVYLDLVGVHKGASGYTVGDASGSAEYGVKMVRLPEEMMMNRVIRRGELSEHHLQLIAQKLKRFYDAADCSERVSRYGTARSVGANVRENFRQTERFLDRSAISRGQYGIIKKYAERFLAQEELFARRLTARKVRECHGDLHSGNICLAPEIAIFDCIEFNESLRCTDVIADIAFLAMDLDYYGLADFSTYFTQYFLELSGDEEAMALLDFYKCYRAYVRGKINLLTSADPAVKRRIAETSIREAKKYFQLAEKYART